MRRFPPVFRPLLIILACALRGHTAAASAGNGPFEGVIDLKLTMEAGSGDLRLSMAGEKAKLDMKMMVNPLPAPLELSVLLDAKSPRTATMINDAMKVYSTINLAETGPGADSAGGKYVLKEIGKEKVLGYACTHITLTRPHELVDAWITQELPDVYRVLRKLQQANPQYGAADAFRALDAAGKSGLPMRCIVVRDGQRVTTEVRKIERKTLPTGLFTVPADYQRTDGLGASGLQPTPAQVEEMKKMIQGALEAQ